MADIFGLTHQNFTSKQIGHLGLVAGMINELGISGIIDEAIPKTRDHVFPHSAIVKAMFLNGLGFNERRLYRFFRSVTYFAETTHSGLYNREPNR